MEWGGQRVGWRNVFFEGTFWLICPLPVDKETAVLFTHSILSELVATVLKTFKYFLIANIRTKLVTKLCKLPHPHSKCSVCGYNKELYNRQWRRTSVKTSSASRSWPDVVVEAVQLTQSSSWGGSGVPPVFGGFLQAGLLQSNVTVTISALPKWTLHRHATTERLHGVAHLDAHAAVRPSDKERDCSCSQTKKLFKKSVVVTGSLLRALHSVIWRFLQCSQGFLDYIALPFKCMLAVHHST